MKITSVEVYAYELEYSHGAYVMSHGRSAESQTSLVVRLLTDDGLEGWAETCPHGATYLPAFLEGERAALEILGEAVVGLDPRQLGFVNRTMDDRLLGGMAAKSAIDVACWDILGKFAGLPVSVLMGGRVNESFRLFVPVPLDSPGAMSAFVTRELALGVRHFQLKVGDQPREDVERVVAVLETAGQECLVIADANGGWSIQSALFAAKALGELPVYLEQPCTSMVDCAQLCSHTALPIVLDECVNGVMDLVHAKTMVGAVGVNIKPGRVGGLTRAKILRDSAQGLGMAVIVDETWGGALTTAALAHLAASTSPDHLLTTSFFSEWTEPHITSGPRRLQDGMGKAPDGPGLGVEIYAELLGAPIFAS